MKRFVGALALILAVPVLAQEKSSTGTPSGASSDNPMAGWVPRKVTNEQATRKEIQAFFKAMDQASRKGDMQTALSLVDFPVLMVTDSSKGEVSAGEFSMEQYQEMMAPFFEKPMPKEMHPTHKPTIFVLTDSLATVVDDWTMTMGGKKVSGKSAMHLVKVDGKWRAKTMVEGGWGDMMGHEGPGAASGTSSGSGMSGSGSGMSGSSGSDKSGSSGSGASGSGTSGTSGSGTSGSSGSTAQPESGGQGSTRTQ